MYDEDISMNQFESDNEDGDEELSRFITSRIGVKNDKSKVVKTQPIPTTKSPLPQQFQKAKRTLNKLVHSFFTQLKSQYQSSRNKLQKLNLNQKIKKNMVQFYLNKDKVGKIVESMREYVGVRYRYKSPMELKFGHLNELSKKQVFEGRRGAVAYLAEAEKVVCLNTKGQTTEIKLTSKVKNFKLPDHATPVPLKDTIYLLDCSTFDSKLKTFLHDPNCYKITDKGQVLTLPNQPKKPRIKCAITKLDNQILLLGGMIGPNKLPTTACQKYHHKTQQFTQLPSLNMRHVCPSACVLNGNLWLFSRNGIEYMDRGQLGWKIVEMPYNINILPYQFVSAYSNTQIMMFGGVGHKGRDLQVYDTVNNWVDVFEDMLPGDVTSNRVSGPCGVEVGVGVMSCVKAQSLPELKEKNNAIQVTYLTNNGIYLQNVGSFR